MLRSTLMTISTILLTCSPTAVWSASSPSSDSSSYDRAACQYPSQDPLLGCPKNTLLVGPLSPFFTTIQAAIHSIPDSSTEPYTILILPGNYTEQLNITRQAPLTLLGQTDRPNHAASNTVHVIWHNATGTAATGSYDNAYTSTLTVAPTLNSSLTGSGPSGNSVPPDTPFGNVDFRAYNVDFVNDFLPYSAGPSLALSVSYANASFYYCQVLSYQDTVYIGKLGNAYMYESIIAGQTDFLYGFGTLWITHSHLLLRGCGGGITAWKGSNTTTFPNKYGAYIHDSEILKANSSLTTTIKHKCALGRPWNSLHRSLFARSYLDDSILPAGYVVWSPKETRFDSGTTLMAEFRNFGPGFDEAARRNHVTVELTEEQFYADFDEPGKVFQFPFSGEGGNTRWIDESPWA